MIDVNEAFAQSNDPKVQLLPAIDSYVEAGIPRDRAEVITLEIYRLMDGFLSSIKTIENVSCYEQAIIRAGVIGSLEQWTARHGLMIDLAATIAIARISAKGQDNG